jgi:hypothetical protein
MAPRPLVRSRHGRVLAVACAALVLTGCGGRTQAPPASAPSPTASPAPDPEPTPAPEETFTPRPVEGDLADVEVWDLSPTDSGLYRSGTAGDARREVDGAGLERFATGMARWVDAHLTDLQDGGEGGDPGTVLEGPPEALHLADADHPVVRARYLARVGTRGTPEWGELRVSVRLLDGSERTATLAFVPGSDGVVLVAAERGR